MSYALNRNFCSSQKRSTWSKLPKSQRPRHHFNQITVSYALNRNFLKSALTRSFLKL
ncbi:hypothetical protein Hanom_Chr04g00326361 [Helianthus anomalus]